MTHTCAQVHAHAHVHMHPMCIRKMVHGPGKKRRTLETVRRPAVSLRAERLAQLSAWLGLELGLGLG